MQKLKDDKEGVSKYIKDYSTLITAGKTGNIAVTYLGSYKLQWRADVDGNTTVIHVTVTNSNYGCSFDIKSVNTIEYTIGDPDDCSYYQFKRQ